MEFDFFGKIPELENSKLGISAFYLEKLHRIGRIYDWILVVICHDQITGLQGCGFISPGNDKAVFLQKSRFGVDAFSMRTAPFETQTTSDLGDRQSPYDTPTGIVLVFEGTDVVLHPRTPFFPNLPQSFKNTSKFVL